MVALINRKNKNPRINKLVRLSSVHGCSSNLVPKSVNHLTKRLERTQERFFFLYYTSESRAANLTRCFTSPISQHKELNGSKAATLATHC